jgi:hypothetical protein
MDFSRFKCHYLFHDRGDTTNGLVEKLENIVIQTADKSGCTEPLFKRPPLPYGFKEDGSALESYRWLRTYLIPELITNSVIFGIGLGGLLAAKLQEDFLSTGISVVAFNSPLIEGAVGLSGALVRNRVGIYSSGYSPISDRVAQWPGVASQVYDVPWLQHGAALPKYAISHLIASYMKTESIAAEIEALKTASIEARGAAIGL